MRRHLRGILKSTASSKPPWRTPDHPPYSQMVEVALRGLSEEGGSTESSISAFIQSNFSGLPWGHDRLLPYYLSKLVASGEVYSPSHDRYQLPVHRPQFFPSARSLGHSRGRHLYRTNPSSYPTFYPLRSSPASRRGRSQGSVPRRGRGRPPLLGRGSPLLLQGEAIGEAAPRNLVRRIRRPRGSRLIKDDSRVNNLSNNGGGESTAMDNPEILELAHAQSLPGETLPLLPPESFPILPSSAPELPEFPEHSQGQPFHNADMLNFSSEIDVEKTVGPETCPLDDLEQPKHGDGAEGQPSVAAQLFEHVEGQVSPVREVPLLTFEQVNVSSFLTPELSEHGEGKTTQEEVQSSLTIEPAKLGEETSTGEGLPLLYPEMPEIDDHEKSVDGFENLSLGKSTALPALEEEVLEPFPLPDGDENERLTVSCKLEKARKRRRSSRLKLWFEG